MLVKELKELLKEYPDNASVGVLTGDAIYAINQYGFDDIGEFDGVVLELDITHGYQFMEDN